MLRVDRSSIAKHWGLLRAELRGILPKVGENYSISNESELSSDVVGELICRRYRYEKVSRDRGGDIRVVPLVDSGNEIKFWLGLRQIWCEVSDARSKRLHYGATNMVVFFGKEGDENKVQLFRAEWPGMRVQPDDTLVFEAPGAGHPHWQIDVYQNRILEANAERQRLADLESALRDEHKIENFADTVIQIVSSEEELERARYLKRLAKIHFASSARWAEFPWAGDTIHTGSHARAPSEMAEITNWVTSTLIYIQSEIAR